VRGQLGFPSGADVGHHGKSTAGILLFGDGGFACRVERSGIAFGNAAARNCGSCWDVVSRAPLVRSSNDGRVSHVGGASLSHVRLRGDVRHDDDGIVGVGGVFLDGWSWPKRSPAPLAGFGPDRFMRLDEIFWPLPDSVADGVYVADGAASL